MILDELKKKAVGAAMGVAATTLVWVGQTTLANQRAADLHTAQLSAQSAQLQRATERVERLDRIAERVVAVQESTQRVLDRLESRAETDRRPTHR